MYTKEKNPAKWSWCESGRKYDYPPPLTLGMLDWLDQSQDISHMQHTCLQSKYLQISINPRWLMVAINKFRSYYCFDRKFPRRTDSESAGHSPSRSPADCPPHNVRHGQLCVRQCPLQTSTWRTPADLHSPPAA